MADAKFEEIADTFAYMNDQLEVSPSLPWHILPNVAHSG